MAEKQSSAATELPILQINKTVSVSGVEIHTIELTAKGGNYDECKRGMTYLLKESKRLQ